MNTSTTSLSTVLAIATLIATGAAIPPAYAQANPETCAPIKAAYPDLAGQSLVVGISPAPANYSATDPNDPSNIIGIEPDLLQSAADCLGFTFTYSKLDFAGLIPALQSGRIDLVAAGMYASDERAKQVNFVQYMLAGEASLVRTGNPKGLTDMAKVCDVTAAQIVGTVENEILDTQSKACVAAGQGPITPLQFPSTDRAFSALGQGRADILLTDAGVATYLADTAPDQVEVGFAIASDFVFGLGVSKDNPKLMEALQASFKAQYDDGSLQAAMGDWGFSEAQLFEPSIKTQ
ncbi:transporter substrate-binding domain-containing protein [uncultured Devosia sp.]|uniref:transporter substrate-binding domain-containing protein n=1 Tax=uncultured Devosia sp. TaxID=211434 RepID=UPI0035CA3A00